MNKVYSETDEEIVRMYVEDKKSSREISVIIGAKSHTTVRRILQKYSIKPNNNRTGRNNLKLRKGHKDVSGSYFCILQHGAKTRDMEFSVSIEYLQEILEKQEYKCALSGVILIFPTSLSIEGRKVQTGSLDRIDSNKGYIEGNVQWVHKTINCIKWKLSQEEFIDWCCKVSNNIRK